jgi:hypothetical protein
MHSTRQRFYNEDGVTGVAGADCQAGEDVASVVHVTPGRVTFTSQRRSRSRQDVSAFGPLDASFDSIYYIETLNSLFSHQECNPPTTIPSTTRCIHSHVRHPGKGATETRRIDGRRPTEHRRAAERQCCACAGWCGRRAALHGPDIPPHHPLDARPSRVEARAILDAQRSAAHHQAGGHRRTVRWARLGAVRHQRHQFCLLLLYVGSVLPHVTCSRTQGTNGPAPGSKRRRSRPGARR